MICGQWSRAHGTLPGLKVLHSDQIPSQCTIRHEEQMYRPSMKILSFVFKEKVLNTERLTPCLIGDFMQRRLTERRVNANVELCFMIGHCHANGALFDIGVAATCASNVVHKVPRASRSTGTRRKSPKNQLLLVHWLRDSCCNLTPLHPPLALRRRGGLPPLL